MNETVKRGLKTGATLAAVTTATMAIASTMKTKSPFSAFNAMATAVGASGRRPREGFRPASSLTGMAMVAGSLVAWGVGYEVALKAAGRQRSALTGALSALGSYALDAWILPDRVESGFVKTMGVVGTIAKYTVMGLVTARPEPRSKPVEMAKTEREPQPQPQPQASDGGDGEKEGAKHDGAKRETQSTQGAKPVRGAEGAQGVQSAQGAQSARGSAAEAKVARGVTTGRTPAR